MRIQKIGLDLDHPKIVPTRMGYGRGLLEAGKKNRDVVALGADISSSVCVDLFRDTFPDRFFNVGIAEQNQMGIGAGLALMGKIPYITNYGVFLSGRAWDQIRTTVCYNNLNVKLGGAHGGISVGPDGATHQALEEIAIMRCIPNMKVVVPADHYETYKATIQAAEIPGPVYIRFGREGVPEVTDQDSPFHIGEAYCCREGTDVAIIACGSMVYEALVAAAELEKTGISAMVVNNHTIKPMDRKTIIEAARATGAVVTVEEHQTMGGMGSAVLEALAYECPVPTYMIGVVDRFGESGSPGELMRQCGLCSQEIFSGVRKLLSGQ